MDVLGLEDTPSVDQSIVYAGFREQLRRSPEGWYETRLPWEVWEPEATGESILVQRLKKTGAVIQEEADMPVSWKEVCMLYKAVVRENANSTKMRVV